MSPSDVTPRPESGASRRRLVKVTVYHNTDARLMTYQDGHHLVAVTSHWLDTTGEDPVLLADWAFHTFNADPDLLETQRDAGGETAFLAACVYRLLGLRSMSVGDVVEIDMQAQRQWLACDPFGWRPISEPAHRDGDGLTADLLYRHLARLRAGQPEDTAPAHTEPGPPPEPGPADAAGTTGS